MCSSTVSEVSTPGRREDTRQLPDRRPRTAVPIDCCGNIHDYQLDAPWAALHPLVMGKRWIGAGARVIVEYTLSLFAGLESVKGWMLDDPTEWLTSFAGLPLYTSLTFFAAGMFLLGSIHFIDVSREVLDRLAQNRRRARDARRDALVKTAEQMIDIYGSNYIGSMEQLSLLELNHSELERFDLAAPDGLPDDHVVKYYRRLLPYLKLGVRQAQQAARSWRARHEGEG